MKICILSYEYHPFPGGGIATYNNAAARILAEAGHEVHIVTNAAWHGSREPSCTHRRWQEGNLHIHRIHYFDDRREVHDNAQFFDLDPNRYSDRSGVWAREPSNQAAHKAVAYLEALHREVGLDVIESPEFFAEAFYVLRRRASGEAHRFPPVCVHGHISSRIAFGINQHVWELGWYPHRQMMLREEYCVQHADALLTPSVALMTRYEELFGDALPELRATMPYFLELPEAQDQLPKGLDAGQPFMVAVGRMEPRKGSDLAMRAFSAIADDHPDLRLVFLGKPMWHQGEEIEDVIAANVEPRHRGRIVRLGNVPREQALAAVRAAKAFLHPAPWDNYPCATLEALGMGAACVVSNQGGQSEMVEHESSGLVFPVGDADALAASMRRMLEDDAFSSKMREGAVERAKELTDAERLLERKIELFEEIVARERRAREGGPDRFEVPPSLDARPIGAELPGGGLVVIDAVDASSEAIATTRASLEVELGNSPHWDVAVFVKPGQEVAVPSDWRPFNSIEVPPWIGRDGEDTVVWMRAGSRLDPGRLRNLVTQIRDARVPCGSFLWLRPKDARAFPYPSDASWQDMLIGGRALVPVFAAKAAQVQVCEFLSGLLKPEHRLAALPAAIAAGADILFQHTGTICGDFYGDLPVVEHETQLRALGYLDVLGLAPRKLTVIGNLPIPVAPTADMENMLRQAKEDGRREGRAAAQKKGGGGGKAAPQPAPKQAVPQSPPSEQKNDGTVRVDPSHLEELEKVYREHQTLKNSAPARMLRKLGVFGAARKAFPKSRKAFGPGN